MKYGFKIKETNGTQRISNLYRTKKADAEQAAKTLRKSPRYTSVYVIQLP